MTEWRKGRGTDTWHFCPNCSNWPMSNYDVSYAEPMSGELDNECRAKEASNTCR